MNTSTATPVIGQTVIATKVYGMDEYNGQAVIVDDIATFYGDSPRIYAEFKSVSKPDDTVRLFFYEWEPITGTNPDVKVGEKVRALNVPAVRSANGRICTVTTVPRGEGNIRCQFDEYVYEGNTYEPNQWYVDEWTLDLSDPSAEPEPTVDVTMIPVADHDRTVESLNAQIDSLTRDRDSLRIRCQQYADDFHLVGEMLLEESNRRNWCSEYDEFVDAVNGKLGLLSLPDREQEYEVEVQVTGTITTTTTVTVTARSQDDANTMVEENMDDYVDADDILTDAARYSSFDDVQCELA